MVAFLITLALGLAAGALIVWLILRERLSATETRLNEALSQLKARDDSISDLEKERYSLTNQLTAAEVRLSEQQTAWQEKLEFRTVLETEFKNLANEILEDKSKRFTDLNKSNLERLLGPLGDKIQDFKTKVEEIETSRTTDQGSLKSELELLRKLNQNISEEANNLTNALKGQSKTLGNLGQIILEDVLEYSGLEREREFLVQKSLTEKDGRRLIPDVIINLPNGRHLIIDAKASLVAYERYCSLPEGPERDGELKQHVASVREHVKRLSEKRYQDHYNLNTVDFVLMFVPFEPAFTVAMQAEPRLFSEAFEKSVIIVGPWTLLATMRTIENLWRPEKLSRNVVDIANQAGSLYEKFVNFVRDLTHVGTSLQAAQSSFEDAHKKLSQGKGNLVSKARRIQELGLKVKKKLPEDLVASAEEDSEGEGQSPEEDLNEAIESQTTIQPTAAVEAVRSISGQSEATVEDSGPLFSAKVVGGSET